MAPGHAGNTDFPFRLGIVRLEVRVNGPVGKPCAGDGTPLAAFPKINFVKAPVVSSEMHGSAAYSPAVLHRSREHSLVCFRLAKRVGLEVVICW